MLPLGGLIYVLIVRACVRVFFCWELGWETDLLGWGCSTTGVSRRDGASKKRGTMREETATHGSGLDDWGLRIKQVCRNIFFLGCS